MMRSRIVVRALALDAAHEAFERESQGTSNPCGSEETQ